MHACVLGECTRARARTHVCESGCGCVNVLLPHAAHQNIFYASHCSRYNNRWHIRAIFQQVLQSHITIIRVRSFAISSSPSRVVMALIAIAIKFYSCCRFIPSSLMITRAFSAGRRFTAIILTLCELASTTHSRCIESCRSRNVRSHRSTDQTTNALVDKCGAHDRECFRLWKNAKKDANHFVNIHTPFLQYRWF